MSRRPVRNNLKAVYSILLQCQKRGFTPSIYEIAAALKISKQMVSRYIHKLEARGKVRRVAYRRIIINGEHEYDL